jgi:hypothetical protein
MNIKKLLSLAFMGVMALGVQAQNQTTYGCGVGLAEGAVIKERLLENRRTVPQEAIDAFQNSRNIKYLPVKFHVVRDANGNGQVKLSNLMAMLCDMNNDFASQDVQFYMQGVTNSINFMNNNNIYNDGAGFTSQFQMAQAKSPGAVNIFISASVGNQVASYYTGAGDFVFILNQMCNGSSSTGTHEVGHYFTLPHTFYGWEGTNAMTSYSPGNVPSSTGGVAVERVSRTSGANCNQAADGFCDTPADYISYRDLCPFTGTLKDPVGVQIDPEESNFMSYFADACVDSFTADQKSAMAADILSRWATFNPPSVTAAVSGNGVTASSPANNSTVELSGNLNISWSAVGGATGYLVSLERSFNGFPISTILDTIVYTNNVTLAAGRLDFPREYIWNIRPVNQYQTCGANSSTFKFNTVEPTTSVINHEVFAENADMRIAQNPLSSSTAEIFINVPKDLVGALNVYSIDGKQLISLQGIQLNAGDNAQLMEVATLSNGVYILQLQTELGSLQQKLVIQR